MKTLHIKIVWIILLLSFSSCQKYLDIKSDSRLASPSTITDFQGLLDDNASMNSTVTPGFGEDSADDYFLTTDQLNGYGFPNPGDEYTWKYDFPILYPDDWAPSYKCIYNSNVCLDGLKKVKPSSGVDQSAWNNVEGSALFFRAYYFLGLLWNYSKAYDDNSSNSDLGIVLRLNSDNTVKSTRSNVKDCYQQVLVDALGSVQYLPDLPLVSMRPSKAAAYGLLARAYLSMRQYDNALKYATLCLGIKNDLMDYNKVSAPFPRFNSETIFYTEMTRYDQLHSQQYANIDTTVSKSYNSNDLRKSLFFFSSNGYPAFRGNYSQNKYINFTGIATDEIYLIRAECYARQNNVTAAMADLNTLLQTRWSNASVYQPITAVNPSDALSKILVERRKELLLRGLRWPDIKRLNKEGANITPTRLVNGQIFTLPPNDNRYALPLPTDIIQQTGMPQNPL